MSKISKEVKREHAEVKRKQVRHESEMTTNFMAGTSFKVNPLTTLKIVSASSIFAEPQYYRPGVRVGGSMSTDGRYTIHSLVKNTLLDAKYAGKNTSQVFESVIDDALSYDFEGTLKWAVELRKVFNMRLNPQIIMVRASLHKDRADFTAEHPGMFNEIEQIVMARADEPMTQLAYFMYLKHGKRKMPSILKRSIAANLSNLSRYKVAKYKNHEIGMINAVRLTHANSKVLDELMTKGTVEVSEDAKTWENLRSAGNDWKYIFHTIDMGHMALLRNIRGAFTEVNDLDFCKEWMGKLKATVVNGKQFPFRYLTAYNEIEKADVNHKQYILDALEECLDIACDNMPKLEGKTMCLSDNSGSAWGAFTSEYGKTTIAEIDNLSSVITAHNSSEGYVGKFGDRLITKSISKRNGVLYQAQSLSSNRSSDVGGSTEGGIWEFFYNAIEKGIWYDNIFIYSDQQAGHGGLYGTDSQHKVYKSMGYGCGGWSDHYINVFDLVRAYRLKVNPKVNVFSIQTAGYTNMVIPENTYRTSILYGWTGKELVYADAINKLWDAYDEEINSSKSN